MSKLSQWKNRDKSSGIPKRSGDLELSQGQKGMLLMHALASNPLIYQYGHTYTFAHDLDLSLLQERLDDFLLENEALRSNYWVESGEVQVAIHDSVEVKIKTEADPAFFTRPFDLKNEPLIRICVSDKRILALSIHHMVGDRQSLELLISELISGRKVEKVDVSYFDYSQWYNRKINQEVHLTYWKDRLSGELPVLQLPHDHMRPKRSKYTGSHVQLTSDSTRVSELSALSRSLGITNYVLILALYNVLLHYYSGQHDILVGSPVITRSRKELNSIFGYFNETIVLRNSIKGSESFKDFLMKVNVAFLQDLGHKDVSFDKLVEFINPPRFLSANPLFQAMLLHNTSLPLTYNGEEVEGEMRDLGISKFDLTLFSEEKQDELVFKLEYSTELFEEETARRMLTDFVGLLDILVREPEMKISDVILPSVKHYVEQLPAIASSEHSSILDLMDFSSPMTAVVFRDESLTYKELGIKADKVAFQLLDAGVRSGDFVGIHCKRSVEMVIGIIAALKAGAAYVPLDPTYPEERIRYMLADCGARIVLFSEVSPIVGHHNIDLKKEEKIKERALPVIAESDHAYMIYTSGSTGKPKGVPITHRNLLTSTLSRFSFYHEKLEAFLLLSSFSFDSSVVGIFWTLCAGGKLVLPEERAEQDMRSLGELVSEQGVSHTLMLPSLYKLMLNLCRVAKLGSLRNVMVAGEQCAPDVVETHYTHLPACNLYNEYGPTEGTVWSIARKLESVSRLVPIGKAVPYYGAYLLNEYGSPVPVGVQGEIHISGQGLAGGYWKRQELTEEKFVEHSLLGRLYKTGDIARLDSAGEIYFLGRKDQQIKILGHRVELDEVKARLLAVPGVEHAEVIFTRGRICAFYSGSILDQGAFSLDLPGYMTPSQYIFLQEWPKLPNGKRDRKGLEKLALRSYGKEVNPGSDGGKPAQAETEEEETLLGIWKEVLKLSEIGVDNNFFSIGGSSLASIQILSLAADQGLELKPGDIFEHQTIRELARCSGGAHQILVPFRKTGERTPLFCIHGGGGHVFFYKKFAEQLSPEIPVYSFQPEGLDGQHEMDMNIPEMAKRYIAEMKKVQPHGPYQILGTCFSNAVAMEMANQLSAAGESLENLFIIDSAPVHLFGNAGGDEKQTLRRFGDMLKRGDFSRISSKIRSRLFGKKKLEGDLKTAIEGDEILAQTVRSMNGMYANYNWKPYQGSINFVRSSEFQSRNDKKYHTVQWKKLALGGLDVSVVDGHHKTLFEEPEVGGLARKVSELILES